MESQSDIDISFLATVSKLLTDKIQDTDWVVYSAMYGFSEIADNTHRLFKSQSWGDPDYPTRVLQFLINAYEKNPIRAIQLGKNIISDLLNDGNYEPNDFDDYSIINFYMSNAQTSMIYNPEKIMEVITLPDDFYFDLVESINLSFQYGIYSGTTVLIRKLLENLLIDVLRKKFGMSQIDLFFNTNYNQFHSFNNLVRNFSDNLNTFQTIITELDFSFIQKINLFRERGNSGAHSLVMDIDRDFFINNKDGLNYLVKMFVRLFNNL